MIEGLPEPAIEERVAEFARTDARHHFHVWRLGDFVGLLLAIALPAELVHAQAYPPEFAVVRRRVEDSTPSSTANDGTPASPEGEAVA